MNPYAIIVAADLPHPDAVARLVELVGPAVDGVKIGLTTVLQAGLTFIKGVTETLPGKPILLDLKIADIGHRTSSGWEGTNAKIVTCLKDSGVTHVTVHGFPGPVSLAEAIAAAHEIGIKVLALPFMSHAGADLFFSQTMNWNDLRSLIGDGLSEIGTYCAGDRGSKMGDGRSAPTAQEIADRRWEIRDGIIALGEATGADGYIGPATNPTALERIRAMTTKPVWCPGFGRQDRLGRDLESQFRDWASIVGPASAAIVGSLIFAASDPLAQSVKISEIRDRAVVSLVSS